MNLVRILQTAVVYFANFLQTIIFIRVIISWLPLSRNGSLIRMLYVLSEPVLGPIRSALRKSPLGGPGMMLDFSPIIAFALIEICKNVLIVLIAQLAGSLT